MIRALIIFTIATITFASCRMDDKRGGVSFTFDDQFIEEWIEYSDLFDKYDVKATFFVSKPFLLDSAAIDGLRELQRRGHEIACHSYSHLNALNFADSVESYFITEIKPAITFFDSIGFEFQSFAYPFGDGPEEIDSILLESFTCLRRATWNKNSTTLNYYDEIFATPDNHVVINSMGIDVNYNITLESIEKGLNRAKEENIVIIFHAHKIDTSHMEYTVNPHYLEEIFKLCQDMKIRSVRITDLNSFFIKQ